jgi:hypothetical protein
MPGPATALPVLMAAMARATGTATATATLSQPILAEMSALCAACPRTDDCRQWLALHAAAAALPQGDLCPNHATFAALQGTGTAP